VKVIRRCIKTVLLYNNYIEEGEYYGTINNRWRNIIKTKMGWNLEQNVVNE